MEEGVIASWLVKEGDSIKSGDILAEVETDKATMELESYEDGVLLHIGAKEKDAVPVDGVIAIIGEKGENIDELLKEIKSGGNGSKDKSKESADTGSAPKQEKEEKKEEATEEVDTSDINASLITMPKMSDTMQEGVIASWLKKEGDEVKSGDILAEVETDKATMELEAYEDGTLLYIGPKEGDSVPVDGVIAVIGEKGADFKRLLKSAESKKDKDSSGVKEEEKTEERYHEHTNEPEHPLPESVEDKSTSESSEGRIKASPLARKMAEEKGYDLTKIKGSAENGRIVKRDIEQYKPSEEKAEKPAQKAKDAPVVNLPQVVGEEKFEEKAVSQMRKTIAKRLAESKYSAPHFYLTMEINMDKAIEARKSINEYSPIKVSFNDLVIKAAAAALRQHPKVNVSWLGDKMRFNSHIHIGVAVAVEEGLLTPVVRFADNKSLSHIAAEVKDLAGRAKDKKLQPKDWEGSTFSVSNLGMFGIDEFTAIINPPNACILAVGGIKETAVVKNGQLVPGNIMKVTLSCDHRAVDGAVGSAFLLTFKGLLEDPVRILV
jgi:pyruvate dehydrogenase E2 component (dihydrolipoamide acetyltransferase)